MYIFTLIDGQEVLTALDAATGQTIWKQSYKGGWTGSYPGSRAAPTIEGEFIYTFGGSGELTCRKLSDGQQVWRVNVLAEKNLDWGVASTPTIDGDRIYVQPGDGGPLALAVDKANGKVVWRARRPACAGYAPVVVAGGGAELPKQVIVFAGKAVCGLDPASGKTLWSFPRVSQWNVNVATPILDKGRVYVTTGYGLGCMLIQLQGDGAKAVYQNKDMQGRMPTPILDAGYLYGNSEGDLVCMKLDDGQVAWREKLNLGFGGTLVRFGDRLIAYSDAGRLMLLEATPAGCKRINQVDLFRGRELWATPLVYDGKLYVKGQTELMCLDIQAKKTGRIRRRIARGGFQ